LLSSADSQLSVAALTVAQLLKLTEHKSRQKRVILTGFSLTPLHCMLCHERNSLNAQKSITKRTIMDFLANAVKIGNFVTNRKTHVW
jgi:hypothetical protein